MADKTTIQWTDSTVNPIMGCGGCELFPPPAKIFLKINEAVEATGHKIACRSIYEDLIDMAYGAIAHPLAGHKNAVNTTNIWHLRHSFLRRVMDETNDDFAARNAAEKAIKQSITCYAADLHLRYAQNLNKQDSKGNTGYAPIFEAVTEFPGRAGETAKFKDLLGICEERAPWKAGLPRLIFVSDMGDALSGLGQFPFLKDDLIPAITSEAGRRHLWMWLTKRPSRLADFAEDIGGLPENVCAMTTLTGPNHENMKRLADLKKVKTHIRGLSIEPLWERIPPKSLDLKGIDWVIVGGESGRGILRRPFALEWAEELRDHCRKKRVAFFLKQLGQNPTRGGTSFKLEDEHGGNWDEWPDEALKIREFPKAYHNYRKHEMHHPMKSKPRKPKKMEAPEMPPTDEEKIEFTRLHQIVKKGVESYVEAGLALREIHQKKLWRVGDYKAWKDYCESVVGRSTAHVQRLMEASEDFLELERALDTPHMPQNESQIRPLRQLKDPEDRKAVWEAVVMWVENQKSNAKITAAVVSSLVDAMLENNREDDGIENEGETVKRPSRVQQRAELHTKFQAAYKERSWEDIEKLIAELEKLI